MNSASRSAPKWTSILVVLAAGCATVRDARLAEDRKSDVPGERTPTAAELGITTSGTILLDDAIRVALRVHPSVLLARRGADAAEARVGEAEAAFLPTASANAGMTYRGQSSGALPASKEKHRFESLGFQVSWLLFDFGRTPALARRAAADWFAAQAEARGAEVDATFAVRFAYFSLVKQIQLRDVDREAVRQFEEHLGQVKEFVSVGTRIPYDQTKAEVDLDNAKLALVQSEDAVLLDQAILATTMGLAEMTDWTPQFDAQEPQAPESFDACVALTRLARPALAAAEAREEAALQLVEAQIGALYPELSVGLGYSQSGSKSPFPWSWQVGPTVSWTPFDGFRNLYTVDEAVAGLKAARAQRAAAEQIAWLDVRTAWIAIEDAKRRLLLTAHVVLSAEENLRLAQGRYDAGVGTSVELTDARQALTQAKSDDVQAHADHDIATARLWRAIGSSLEPSPPPSSDAPPTEKKP